MTHEQAMGAAREVLSRGPFYPEADIDPAVHFALDQMVARGEARWTWEGYVKREQSA